MADAALEITTDIALRETGQHPNIVGHRERMAVRMDTHEDTRTLSPNERIARTFAEQFTPPLLVCSTERINNMPVPDAWAVSYHDSARGLGITAVAYHGQLHAYMEAAGKGEIAEHAGQVMAKAVGLFQEEATQKD